MNDRKRRKKKWEFKFNKKLIPLLIILIAGVGFAGISSFSAEKNDTVIVMNLLPAPESEGVSEIDTDIEIDSENSSGDNGSTETHTGTGNSTETGNSNAGTETESESTGGTESGTGNSNEPITESGNDEPDDRDFTFRNVEEMKSSHLSVGSCVTTAGYYTARDGGSATYNIEKTSSFGSVQLESGLYANPVFSGGVVNVKAIGAVGDGSTDDAGIIKKALNSGYSIIEFPKARYACNSHITMTKPGVTIRGNYSTLVTNDNFNADYKEWFFIVKADNISIDRLKLECAETHTHKFKSQMGIMDSNGVDITNCEFYIPYDVMASNPTRKIEYSNLDIYANCKNVSIDNCFMIDEADAYAGLCCQIRDLFGKGSSNISFTNNTCYHVGRDEVFAVFSNVTHSSSNNSMSNVIVTGNKFYKSSNNYINNVGITLGFENNGGVDGLIFSGNLALLTADCIFAKVGSSTNVEISNNTIECTILRSDMRAYLVYAYDGANNIDVKNNNITVIPQRADNYIIKKGNVNIGQNSIVVR
ncbi:glycosyl hydrolase family 28-related protein [Butyrivibrio sp. MB2005]|uniref:glycosyl hydrolase family 28-related protein n=1 Tax=Butyrivibrio sp. MB2005 TaxID=1280678 RepID=UPI0004171F8B|nr:glycosyl hydrolase family 28-related protein [Butyrivibrio sp. MB2005]